MNALAHFSVQTFNGAANTQNVTRLLAVSWATSLVSFMGRDCGLQTALSRGCGLSSATAVQVATALPRLRQKLVHHYGK